MKVLSSSFHLCVDPDLYTVVVIAVVFKDRTVHSGLSNLHKSFLELDIQYVIME